MGDWTDDIQEVAQELWSVLGHSSRCGYAPWSDVSADTREQFCLAARAAGDVMDKQRARRPLSPRQREILGWAAQGKSLWEISRIVGLSQHTTRHHRDLAVQKLDAVNLAQAVAKGVAMGLVDPQMSRRHV